MASTASRISAQGNAFRAATGFAPDSASMKEKVMGGTSCRNSQQPEWPASYPTVLVGVEDGELRQLLVDRLHQDDFLVLEADSSRRVLDVVIRHSRPIHVLLLETGIGDREFEALLKRFRSYMQ